MRNNQTKPTSAIRRGATLAAVSASLLGAALFAPSCQVVAAAGLGVAISQEFTENAHSLRLTGNFEETWQATMQALDALSLDPVEIDQTEHSLKAIVRGKQILAHVRAHENSETVLSITAKSYGRYDNEMAQEILFRVKDRMSQ